MTTQAWTCLCLSLSLLIVGVSSTSSSIQPVPPTGSVSFGTIFPSPPPAPTPAPTPPNTEPDFAPTFPTPSLRALAETDGFDVHYGMTFANTGTGTGSTAADPNPIKFISNTTQLRANIEQGLPYIDGLFPNHSYPRGQGGDPSTKCFWLAQSKDTTGYDALGYPMSCIHSTAPVFAAQRHCTAPQNDCPACSGTPDGSLGPGWSSAGGSGCLCSAAQKVSYAQCPGWLDHTALCLTGDYVHSLPAKQWWNSELLAKGDYMNNLLWQFGTMVSTTMWGHEAVFWYGNAAITYPDGTPVNPGFATTGGCAWQKYPGLFLDRLLISFSPVNIPSWLLEGIVEVTAKMAQIAGDIYRGMCDFFHFGCGGEASCPSFEETYYSMIGAQFFDIFENGLRPWAPRTFNYTAKADIEHSLLAVGSWRLFCLCNGSTDGSGDSPAPRFDVSVAPYSQVNTARTLGQYANNPFTSDWDQSYAPSARPVTSQYARPQMYPDLFMRQLGPGMWGNDNPLGRGQASLSTGWDLSLLGGSPAAAIYQQHVADNVMCHDHLVFLSYRYSACYLQNAWVPCASDECGRNYFTGAYANWLLGYGINQGYASGTFGAYIVADPRYIVRGMTPTVKMDLNSWCANSALHMNDNVNNANWATLGLNSETFWYWVCKIDPKYTTEYYNEWCTKGGSIRAQNLLQAYLDATQQCKLDDRLRGRWFRFTASSLVDLPNSYDTVTDYLLKWFVDPTGINGIRSAQPTDLVAVSYLQPGAGYMSNLRFEVQIWGFKSMPGRQVISFVYEPSNFTAHGFSAGATYFELPSMIWTPNPSTPHRGGTYNEVLASTYCLPAVTSWQTGTPSNFGDPYYGDFARGDYTLGFGNLDPTLGFGCPRTVSRSVGFECNYPNGYCGSYGRCACHWEWAGRACQNRIPDSWKWYNTSCAEVAALGLDICTGPAYGCVDVSTTHAVLGRMTLAVCKCWPGFYGVPTADSKYNAIYASMFAQEMPVYINPNVRAVNNMTLGLGVGPLGYWNNSRYQWDRYVAAHQCQLFVDAFTPDMQPTLVYRYNHDHTRLTDGAISQGNIVQWLLYRPLGWPLYTFNGNESVIECMDYRTRIGQRFYGVFLNTYWDTETVRIYQNVSTADQIQWVYGATGCVPCPNCTGNGICINNPLAPTTSGRCYCTTPNIGGDQCDSYVCPVLNDPSDNTASGVASTLGCFSPERGTCIITRQQSNLTNALGYCRCNNGYGGIGCEQVVCPRDTAGHPCSNVYNISVPVDVNITQLMRDNGVAYNPATTFQRGSGSAPATGVIAVLSFSDFVAVTLVNASGNGSASASSPFLVYYISQRAGSTNIHGTCNWNNTYDVNGTAILSTCTCREGWKGAACDIPQCPFYNGLECNGVTYLDSHNVIRNVCNNQSSRVCECWRALPLIAIVDGLQYVSTSGLSWANIYGTDNRAYTRGSYGTACELSYVDQCLYNAQNATGVVAVCGSSGNRQACLEAQWCGGVEHWLECVPARDPYSGDFGLGAPTCRCTAVWASPTASNAAKHCAESLCDNQCYFAPDPDNVTLVTGSCVPFCYSSASPTAAPVLCSGVDGNQQIGRFYGCDCEPIKDRSGTWRYYQTTGGSQACNLDANACINRATGQVCSGHGTCTRTVLNVTVGNTTTATTNFSCTCQLGWSGSSASAPCDTAPTCPLTCLQGLWTRGQYCVSGECKCYNNYASPPDCATEICVSTGGTDTSGNGTACSCPDGIAFAPYGSGAALLGCRKACPYVNGIECGAYRKTSTGAQSRCTSVVAANYPYTANCSCDGVSTGDKQSWVASSTVPGACEPYCVNCPQVGFTCQAFGQYQGARCNVDICGGRHRGYFDGACGCYPQWAFSGADCSFDICNSTGGAYVDGVGDCVCSGAYKVDDSVTSTPGSGRLCVSRCANGGTVNPDKQTCSCSSLWKGSFCDVARCTRGGYVANPGVDTACTCPYAQWGGPLCDQIQCVFGDPVDVGEGCACWSKYYTGTLCDVNLCTANTYAVLSGTVTRSNSSSVDCLCKPGFNKTLAGDICTVNLCNPGLPVPCSGSGCTYAGRGYECICPSPYIQTPNGCESVDCSQHGTVTWNASAAAVYCACDADHAGPFCSQLACVAPKYAHLAECVCPPRLAGPNCEIDTCGAGSNGTLLNGTLCNCVDGYSAAADGASCEIDPYYCNPLGTLGWVAEGTPLPCTCNSDFIGTRCNIAIRGAAAPFGLPPWALGLILGGSFVLVFVVTVLWLRWCFGRHLQQFVSVATTAAAGPVTAVLHRYVRVRSRAD